MTDTLPTEVTQWLSTLEQALTNLPEAERSDIVNEARGHMEERIAAGLAPSNALHGFGDAKTYAQGFIDDHSLNHALSSRRILPMIKTLVSFAGRSTVAFFGLMGTLLFGGIALGSAISIVLKTIRPDKVGLWVNEAQQQYVLGTWNQADPAHEIAGVWVYPIFVVMLLVGAVLARYCLVGALSMIRGKRPAAA